MFRFLDISINGTQASLSLDSFTYVLSLAILFLGLLKSIRGVPMSKVLLLTLVPCVSALYGGRFLYHWIVEHRFSFEGGGGQAYYGAFFSQSIIFYLLTRVLLSEPQQRTQAIDLFSVASLFVYSLLRIGCFANGCCYGKLCRYPWAVIFTDERSLTPLLGLPLHPTQLYGVIHGFFAGCIMVLLYKKRKTLHLEGRFYGLFLILMGVGRMVMDPFRADLKSSLWLGLAMNQWISCAVILLGSYMLLGPQVWKGISSSRKAILPSLLILLNLLFTGCGLTPQPPGPKIVARTTTLNSGIFIHSMVNKPSKGPKINRKLLFIAVDDSPEDFKIFQPALSKLYKTDEPPRMEEVLWWHYSPKFAHLYQEVVRIQYDSLDWAALFTALQYLESSQVPFDIFLLTHGIPNHLISSKNRLPISWKDFQVFSGENRLQFLHTVFLQSCFGNSLASDFKTIGASSIISFQGFHNNLLFFEIFLKKYILKNGNGNTAFQNATSSFERKITHNLIYRHVIKHLLDITPHEYANEIRENNWMPSLLE